MKNHVSSRRGIAAEIVILAVALIGGAGFFGVKEIKQAVAQHELNKTAQEAAIRQAATEAAAAAAALERTKADQALAAAEAARNVERTKQVQTGRNIQRASVQGALVVAQLPTSLERSLLVDRFLEIDTASAHLFDVPQADELKAWRKLASDALAGQAEAQAKLADQINEVRRLGTELDVAKSDRKKAEDQARTAQLEAQAADAKFATAFSESKVAVSKMIAAATKGDTFEILARGLGLVVAAVVGIWVLGLVLKIFSIGVPQDGLLANFLNTAANTFHSLLAPMAVLGETHAKRNTEKLVESAGNFVTDVREQLPKDVQDKVTNMMDVTLSPAFQHKVCTAHRKIRLQRAADAGIAALGGQSTCP